MTAFKFRSVDAPASTELLRGLDQQEIDSVLAATKPRHFHASSVMTHQGEPADKLFLAVDLQQIQERFSVLSGR